jgi:uncharacterized membrane protein
VASSSSVGIRPNTALQGGNTAQAATVRGVRTQITAWVMVIGGLCGLAAAFVLTIEKIQLAADPTHIPSCSINPVLSCGSVMSSPQASVFGFPNSLLGLIGFAIVMTCGAVAAGGVLGRWIWVGLQVGLTGAIVFVHWLIYQSLYVIGALCPYCMVVWIVSAALFVVVTTRNLHAVGATRWRAGGLIARYAAVIVTGWTLAVTALIANRFWYYWTTLL